VLSLTFGFVFFDRNATNFLLPFIAPELHLNNTEIGMLSSALSLTWALSAYGFGILTDAKGIMNWKKSFSGGICCFESGRKQRDHRLPATVCSPI
jgi:MFS family permease